MRLDKWLYFIKYLEDFQTIPAIFKNEIVFEQAFEKAELARLHNEQWESYERSLKDHHDMKDYIDTAFSEGEMKGKIEGRVERNIEIAGKMKQKGLSIREIAEMAGLSEDEIHKLQGKHPLR